MFNASENLAYGCWDDGLYRYGGYYGNGAPSDWAGIMLVSTIYINGEVNGYLTFLDNHPVGSKYVDAASYAFFLISSSIV